MRKAPLLAISTAPAWPAKVGATREGLLAFGFPAETLDAALGELEAAGTVEDVGGCYEVTGAERGAVAAGTAAGW
jgi:hypothetical protein